MKILQWSSCDIMSREPTRWIRGSTTLQVTLGSSEITNSNRCYFFSSQNDVIKIRREHPVSCAVLQQRHAHTCGILVSSNVVVGYVKHHAHEKEETSRLADAHATLP
jgi:hypothetical protein